jgi:hypothetical protein
MTPWRHLSFRASFCHLFWHGKQSQSNLIKFPSKISHLTYAFRDQVWFAIRFAQSPRLFTKWPVSDRRESFSIRILYWGYYLQSQERFQRHFMVPTRTKNSRYLTFPMTPTDPDLPTYAFRIWKLNQLEISRPELVITWIMNLSFDLLTPICKMTAHDPCCH